ncbi:85/88 kDa calcium-independent phospholipase A2 [Copidosoma floridanum]|uniref:85/88 kDa calcium-independent phospholipase A2 n=1 Tax=Copidosoma floridanum TaxID=29053 RepID=UPI0006C950BA|nr:85/88 kDa calcium-independent phospholipase A2 [Copidosoma floridanum]
MAWLGSIACTVLKNIVFSEVPADQVLEIKTTEYHKRNIHCREDGIILYSPGSREKEKFEIVLHKPYSEKLHYTGYSLYRSNILEKVELRFTILKDKVPLLVELSKEMSNVNKIQSLCDTLVEHPTWNLAHIAAHLLLYDAFDSDIVNSCLNSGDSETGASPLQIAIKSNNLQIVQMLIAANSSREHLDFKANTVYHYAASSTKDIIMALGADLPNTLNSRNSDGYTPMHLACLSDKPDCVKALLLIGADCNLSASEGTASTPGYVGDFIHNQPYSLKHDDMKFGGTPLHWCCSKEVINTLLSKNCDINALNFDGRTALHMMVIRKRLDCVAALLSHMADINIVDKGGNSPLHLAVKESTPAIVQLLIAFGAEINARNWQNESPRHLVNKDSADGQKILYILHAVGAERCTRDVIGCDVGCKYDENFNGIAPPEAPSAVPRTAVDDMLHASTIANMALTDRKRFKGGRLLCMDGGGIRGLVLVQTLLEIEAVLNKPITNCFDWIAGTSTGGILALGLAAGRSLKECQALYFRIKDNAFVGKRPYSSEPLENALKECLGSETVMSDIRHPKLMIMGVLADRKPVDLHIFRNYHSPSNILNVATGDQFKDTLPPEEQLLWKAARATGAAPSYFRAFGRFLDGGLIANNPTLDAMTEIHEYNLALEASNRSSEKTPLSLVVSLGTGAIPLSPLQNVDVYWPEGLLDTAKLASRLKTFATLLVDQATAADGRVVDRARAWCSMIDVPYYRFNPQMSREINMDEDNDAILAEMLWETKAFMHTNRHQIKHLADVLDFICNC